MGITKDINDRATALMNVGVDVVTLDSAHGHSKGVINALKALKKNFKNLQVIAGNIGTAAGAKALAEAGADCRKKLWYWPRFEFVQQELLQVRVFRS